MILQNLTNKYPSTPLLAQSNGVNTNGDSKKLKNISNNYDYTGNKLYNHLNNLSNQQLVTRRQSQINASTNNLNLSSNGNTQINGNNQARYNRHSAIVDAKSFKSQLTPSFWLELQQALTSAAKATSNNNNKITPSSTLTNLTSRKPPLSSAKMHQLNSQRSSNMNASMSSTSLIQNSPLKREFSNSDYELNNCKLIRSNYSKKTPQLKVINDNEMEMISTVSASASNNTLAAIDKRYNIPNNNKGDHRVKELKKLQNSFLKSASAQKLLKSISATPSPLPLNKQMSN